MYIKFYISLSLVLVASFVLGQDNFRTYLFVGSYTSGEEADGIVVFAFDTETGKLTEVKKEGNLINPSFLSISPNGKFLYACTETKLDKHGSVSAFKIDTLSGELTFLNKQTTGGRNPVHLVISPTNDCIIVSNYSDAGICVLECNPDGSLQPFSQLLDFDGNSTVEGRQDNAHIHSSTFSPDNKYVFSPDLGSDKIRAFKFDQKNLLMTVESLTINTAKGHGPRHFTFHPNKSFAYCVEELSGTVSFYKYKNGQLSLSNTYDSYMNDQEEYASSDIHISPDGKFLYTSNRQDENSISIFRIDETNGDLLYIESQTTYGTIPRSFVIDPTGKYLLVANQTSNNLIVFRRDSKTGLLTKLSETTGLNSPSSLKMTKYSR